MVEEIPPFRTFLNTIANELVSDELEELKYLCYPRLTKARLQKVSSPQQLFVAISEVISEEDEQLIWLKELLHNIWRIDLESRIETFLKLRKEAQNRHRFHVQAASSFWNGEVADSRVSTAVSTSDYSGPKNRSRSQPQEIDISRDIVQYKVTCHPQGCGGGEGKSTSSVPFMSSGESEKTSNGIIARAPDPNIEKYGLRSGALGATKQIYGYPQHSTSQPVETESLKEGTRDHIQPVSSDLLQHTRSSTVKVVNGDNQKALSCQLTTNPSQCQSLRQTDFSLAGIASFQTSVVSGHIPQPRYQTDSGQSRMETSQDERVREFNSQPSVPFGQEEQFPFQTEVPIGQQHEAQFQASPLDPSGRDSNHSNSQDRTTTGNAHLIPSSSMEREGTDELLAQKRLRCPREMTYREMEDYFRIGSNKLGEGRFGTVYKGCKKFHGKDVVVKVQRWSTYGAAQLKREIMVGFIKHPNLMPLYALCEEKGKPRCLMYPLMHCDLQKALRKDSRGKMTLPWECRVRIALHISRGLQYLHSRVLNESNVRQGTAHMEVKPSNIYLDDGLNARLGDARMVQELPVEFSFNSISIRGTDGYLDPYYLRDTDFKPINDLFSFGIVLLQLLTQREALEPRTANKHVKLWEDLQENGALVEAETLVEAVRSSIWLKRDPAKQFCAIAINCLKKPDERAKLQDICDMLEGILEKERQEFYVSRVKDGRRCASCLLNISAKYLGVKSPRCDSQTDQSCNHFCVTCLTEVQRNPVECPAHGPAQPPIGRNNTYAVLVCGDDPNNPRAAAAFRRDVSNFRNTLTDNRIIGVRHDHLYYITPSSCEISVGAEVKRKLEVLEEELHGKNDVFLYFYFSGHSDKRGNLICSSGEDLLNAADLQRHFERLKPFVEEFIIILDCCFADGNITSKPLGNDKFLVTKSETDTRDTTETPVPPLYSLFPEQTNASTVRETDFDSLDGAVMIKSPPPEDLTDRPGTFNVRQWSSSLSQQESFAMQKGSFFTKFLICGLRGAHECSLQKDCFICKKFQEKAKVVGYISAEDLGNYISEHVIKAVETHDKQQKPRMRALHSKETVLAYYNGEKLRDEIKFKTASGSLEMILVNKFQASLVEFQSYVVSELQGKLPPSSKGKHLQVLCDGEEVDSTSFHGVMNFARQGYDIKCQLRPCSSIDQGPVMVEIQNAKIPVESFLDSLGLEKQKMEGFPHYSFLADTFARTYTDYDVDESLDENPTLRELLDESLLDSITVMLKTASLHQGSLRIHVYEDHLDCVLEVSRNLSNM